MEVGLVIVILLMLTFLLRFIVLNKIKKDNYYREPSNNNYVAIPSIKILDQVCFCLTMLYMALGLFLFELFYTTPKPLDKISWYFMVVCLGLNGLYYAMMLHTQYFYVYFGKDHIEFNLRIGKRSKDAVKLSTEEIDGINKSTNEYYTLSCDRLLGGFRAR